MPKSDKEKKDIIDTIVKSYQQGLETGVQIDGTELAEAAGLIIDMARDTSAAEAWGECWHSSCVAFCEKYGYKYDKRIRPNSKKV